MKTEYIELNTSRTTVSRIAIGRAAELLKELLHEQQTVVITDENVHALYGDLTQGFEHIVLPAGEQAKTPETVIEIHRRMIASGIGRGAFVLGVGGGVVTDLAGFAASTYMRGVRFGFVATTLLAQVDAAIGGKNGVNVGGFKNMVGTFAQPEFVLCDPSMLLSLPAREFRSGLAEVIKAGVIADPALFAMFENGGAQRLATDPELLREAVAMAVRVKVSVVERDEREGGLRRVLNLGHTFGHAIESLSRDYTHGEAVAVGIYTAADIAVRMGMLEAQEAERIAAVIAATGLPLSTNIAPAEIFRAIYHDKKSTGEGIHLVLPTGIGSCAVRLMAFDELGELFASK